MGTSIYERLEESLLFAGLTADEIEWVLQTVNYKIVEYPAKAVYAVAGMPCKYADIIIKGEMISRMNGISGKQVQIDRLRGCILIAPAFIFAENNAMPVSVETVCKTTILRMLPGELKRLIDTNERIRMNFIRRLSSIDAFLTQKLRMLSLFTVREKVAYFLIKAAKEQQSRTIQLGISRQEMADLFGIQKFSLLRCLSEFESNGAIKVDGKQITILNSDKMK
ncbi:MAG: Crp/Fnr family transcriptional regulator [Prevotella sp.]|uniref:Crp/Fnr family transcriptional regulator n=1 Tax=Prevotella sp. TaxID=59823 RepID=UPI002A2E078A|nr:Crp/Fnr family transcriptional regulator [Prevotella sp.]MDD7318381.1 Crp/Fnr family transcriptional regulator [Prevotellaceae bacterium]MDY4020268.1 Crp/Fnr family transcriptional regulator [Prevotella sp.]